LFENNDLHFAEGLLAACEHFDEELGDVVHGWR
jgi:hypothetical protein